MKLIYLKWSPVSTIILIVTIVIFIWYILSKGKINFTGYLGIIILFIARGIMWQGWWMEKNKALQDEINSLKKQK